MVRTSKFTIGKAKVKLIGGWIAKKCRLTKLHSKMKLIGGWICKKFVEACAQGQLKDVTKHLSGLKSTVAPGDKNVNQSPSGEQHSGLDNDLIMFDSDSDVNEADQNAQPATMGSEDDRAAPGDGEPERGMRTPRHQKWKTQRNQTARLQVEANNGPEVKGTNEQQTRRTLAPAPDKERQKHPCKWPNCNKCFSCRSKLLRHQRTHTGVKPFKCTWLNCGKTFSSNTHCTRHRRIHTGETPYVCDWPNCHKLFNRNGNLKAHRRTHTGERPYVCNWLDCNKSFGHSSTLLVHRKTHTGDRPFHCGFCDRRCVSSSDLARHIRTHTREKPYKCHVCAATFTDSSNKVRHEKLHN